MDKSPAPAPADTQAPGAERRLGPLNPLTVAVAVLLLAAGGAFGWSIKGAAPTARAAPEAVRRALGLERIERAALCAPGGEDLLREAVLRGDSAPADHLTDYLPKKSPIPGFEKVRAGALDAAGDPDYLPGAVEGHVAGFAPAGDGGFDVYAYRFLTRPAAVETLAGTVAEKVCRSGATAFEARGRPGMLVVRDAGAGGRISAWSLTRADVVVISYGGWGDPDADLANLVVVARATAAPR
ncbi:MAG TPA: hypothetical protein VG318_04905 [Actinomycetota bacterium]|nr:hypothetical protein [Actinomycetota bacterium]